MSNATLAAIEKARILRPEIEYLATCETYDGLSLRDFLVARGSVCLVRELLEMIEQAEPGPSS